MTNPGLDIITMTSKLVLYGDYISPYSVAAAHTLLEKGLSWEYRHVNIRTFETRSLEHRKRHPFGKIPVLDVVNSRGETIRIYESRAITRYIATVYSKEGNSLIPDINDVEAIASFEEAASVEVCYFSPTAWKFCGEIMIKPVLGLPRADDKSIQDLWNELKEVLKKLDGVLSGRMYLAGTEFTLADVWSMPWVSQLVDVKGADIVFADSPHLLDWWNRVSLRPAWTEAAKLMNEALEVMKQDEAEREFYATQTSTC